MEHSLHLGAGHFIAGVMPANTKSSLKKIEIHGGSSEDNTTDFEEGFDIANTMRKALALVQQV
jgi:hypothetical protein